MFIHGRLCRDFDNFNGMLIAKIPSMYSIKTAYNPIWYVCGACALQQTWPYLLVVGGGESCNKRTIIQYLKSDDQAV